MQASAGPQAVASGRYAGVMQRQCWCKSGMHGQEVLHAEFVLQAAEDVCRMHSRIRAAGQSVCMPQAKPEQVTPAQ